MAKYRLRRRRVDLGREFLEDGRYFDASDHQLGPGITPGRRNRLRHQNIRTSSEHPSGQGISSDLRPARFVETNGTPLDSTLRLQRCRFGVKV